MKPTNRVAQNVVSVSGGKDSTALLLLAIERQVPNLQAVFADTGHEHPQTYEYVRYLEQATGVPIRWVRADFSARIASKATYIREKWMGKLTKSTPGYWEWDGDEDEQPDTYPGPPADESGAFCFEYPGGNLTWTPPVPGMSQAEAQAIINRALAVLDKGGTGNPFLDLCLWKGRFPSTKARFCSEELKRNPIIEQVQMPLLDAGEFVVSWQGVRADESASRALLEEWELSGSMANGGEMWNYRPILKWTAAECFAMHRKHGIKHNPLYEQGMGRVGCMPCIHSRKDELLEISRRFPGEVDRVAEWERIVARASKRSMSTFFPSVQADPMSSARTDISHESHGIWSVVEWSKTSRGGRQYDLLRVEDLSGPTCKSNYGLCE